MLNYIERCCDCVALVCDGGAWVCDEIDIPCDSIIDCGEWTEPKMNASQFCEFFDFSFTENTDNIEFDGEIPKYYAKDNQEYFYTRTGNSASDFVNAFEICENDYIDSTLENFGFEYDEQIARETSYYEQAQQWIETECTDLYDTDTYWVIYYINHPYELRV